MEKTLHNSCSSFIMRTPAPEWWESQLVKMMEDGRPLKAHNQCVMKGTRQPAVSV
jgi:hypothetical protein